jgi:threonine dehydrogenase-like Zn-dependent dehydrogenase
MGASKIVAIDNVAHRLELVKQKYGAETINFAETPDVVMAIKKLVGPDGLDKGIDASGFRYTKTVMQSLQRAIGASTDSSDVQVKPCSGHTAVLMFCRVNEIILSVRKFGKIALIADL